MIISKKKFEQMVQERLVQEISRKDYERFIDERFNEIWRRMNQLDEKIDRASAGQIVIDRRSTTRPCDR